MKEFKRALLILVSAFVLAMGFTACNNLNVPEGDELEEALQGNTDWLIGNWDVFFEIKQESKFEDFPADVTTTTELIQIDSSNVEEKRNGLLNEALQEPEIANDIKENLDAVPGAKLKSSSYQIVNSNRTKISIYYQYVLKVFGVKVATISITENWTKR